MNMRTLKELREKFCEELDEIARKGELNAGDLETVHKLTDTIKNIDKICMLEEDGGYSGDGEWAAHSIYDDGRTYGGGHSYAGRKRDSMGRYSRDGGKEHMISKLENMMHGTDNERTKEAIKKCISEIERD